MTKDIIWPQISKRKLLWCRGTPVWHKCDVAASFAGVLCLTQHRRAGEGVYVCVREGERQQGGKLNTVLLCQLSTSAASGMFAFRAAKELL